MEDQLLIGNTRVHGFGGLELSASAMAIGAFDGVHKGHQTLINMMKTSARKMGVPSVIYTFDPPPKVHFGAAAQIISTEEKIDRLSALEPDHIVVVHFDENYRQRTAHAFLAEIGALNPEAVWVGDDFRFGACKSGNPELLASYFNTRVIERECCSGGAVISSTRIRELSAAGHIKEAADLQGWSGFSFAGANRSVTMGVLQ